MFEAFDALAKVLINRSIELARRDSKISHSSPVVEVFHMAEASSHLLLSQSRPLSTDVDASPNDESSERMTHVPLSKDCVKLIDAAEKLATEQKTYCVTTEVIFAVLMDRLSANLHEMQSDG